MTLTLGLIGCGGIARRHILSLKELNDRGLEGCDVVAVCDANEAAAREKATLIQTELGQQPTVYTDYKELLDKETIDGADLCLPHGLHHSVAIDCMEAGAHVLCEKPLGITIKACRIMAEAADRTGRILATAVPHRRQPGQRAAHWVLNQSDLMGAPLTFSHHYARPPAPRSPSAEPVSQRVNWRRDKLMSGGGPVLDSGFHYCDSMCYFFGAVEKVYAELRALEDGQSVSFVDAPENAVFVTITFKSGVVGTWSWNLAAPGAAQHNVVFYGSGGALRDTTPSKFAIFHLFERRPDAHESGELMRADGEIYPLNTVETMYLDTLSADAWKWFFPGGATDGFTIEIWDFLEAVRGNRDGPEVDGWEGLRSLALGEAIYESALTGDVVQVDAIISEARDAFQAPINAYWGL